MVAASDLNSDALYEKTVNSDREHTTNHAPQ